MIAIQEVYTSVIKADEVREIILQSAGSLVAFQVINAQKEISELSFTLVSNPFVSEKMVRGTMGEGDDVLDVVVLLGDLPEGKVRDATFIVGSTSV